MEHYDFKLFILVLRWFKMKFAPLTRAFQCSVNRDNTPERGWINLSALYQAKRI